MITPHPAVRALLPAAALPLVAVVAATVVLTGMGQPVRALAGLTLVGLAPGAALVRRQGVNDPLVRAVLAVCLSLSATTAISLALMYLHQWSWQRCVLALAVLTVLLAVPWRRPPPTNRSPTSAERTDAERTLTEPANAEPANAEPANTQRSDG